MGSLRCDRNGQVNLSGEVLANTTAHLKDSTPTHASSHIIFIAHPEFEASNKLSLGFEYSHPPLTLARPLDTPKPLKNTMFFGDSQLDGVAQSGKLRALAGTGSSVYATRGRPLAAAIKRLQQKHHPEYLTLQRSKRVVLFFGGNDISAGDTATQIIELYQSLLKRIRSINPKIKIYVADIPWRWEALKRPPDWLAELQDQHGWQACERQVTLERVNAWIAKQKGFKRIPVNDWVGTYNGRIRCTQVADAAKTNAIRPEFRQWNPDVHLNDSGYDYIGTRLGFYFEKTQKGFIEITFDRFWSWLTHE